MKQYPRLKQRLLFMGVVYVIGITLMAYFFPRLLKASNPDHAFMMVLPLCLLFFVLIALKAVLRERRERNYSEEHIHLAEPYLLGRGLYILLFAILIFADSFLEIQNDYLKLFFVLLIFIIRFIIVELVIERRLKRGAF